MPWSPNVWSDTLDRLQAFLPNLVGALVVLLIGWLLAWLAKRITRRVLGRVGFDRFAERTGVIDALTRVGISESASYLMGRAVYWLLLLGFLMVAVETSGLTAVAGALQALVAYLPRMLGAVIVLVGGAVLGRFLGKGAEALAVGSGVEFHALLGKAVQYLVLTMVIILSVDQLGLNTRLLSNTVTNLLTVTGAGLALALALGSQGAVRNLLAGFYAKELFEIGQTVRIDMHEGTLEAIGPLKAVIALPEGWVTVPNSALMEQGVTTLS